jgi:hypothetical protein
MAQKHTIVLLQETGGGRRRALRAARRLHVRVCRLRDHLRSGAEPRADPPPYRGQQRHHRRSAEELAARGIAR